MACRGPVPDAHCMQNKMGAKYEKRQLTQADSPRGTSNTQRTRHAPKIDETVTNKKRTVGVNCLRSTEPMSIITSKGP